MSRLDAIVRAHNAINSLQAFAVSHGMEDESRVAEWSLGWIAAWLSDDEASIERFEAAIERGRAFIERPPV